MRITRTVALVGAAASIALGTAACGSSSSSKPAAASTAAQVTVNTLTGKQTAVTLNTSTVAALKSLGVSVAPEGSANIQTLSDGAAVAFPITGGHVQVFPKTVSPYVQGELDHNGSGLTFTAGAKTVTVTDFVVDPGKSMLTATLGGSKGVPLFFLDGSALQISGPTNGAYLLDGTVVKLLPSAARALETAFGAKPMSIPDYAPIGIAHIAATGT